MISELSGFVVAQNVGFDACEPTNSLSPRDDLFDQHHDRQTRDPGQVHDPEDEKERHQHRAAAKTIEAVRQPESRGAGVPAATAA